MGAQILLALTPPLSHQYDAGHQMYTHLPSLKKLKGDVATFYKKALAYVAN